MFNMNGMTVHIYGTSMDKNLCFFQFLSVGRELMFHEKSWYHELLRCSNQVFLMETSGNLGIT
jgi:hypothetical protein